MGCWNKTCAISQFPIFAGDKTVTFVLVESGMKYRDANPCYPSSSGWLIIPIPFYGTYNDYGWQDDDDGQQSKYDFLAEHYKDELIEVESQKSRAASCYPAMTGPFDNNESLGNSIHGNIWNLSNPHGEQFGGPKTRRMASFMISRTVWDAITSKTLMSWPKREWFTREQLAESLTAYLQFAANKRAEKEANSAPLDAEAAHLKKLMDKLDSMLAGASLRVATEYIESAFGEKSYFDPRAALVRFCTDRISGAELKEMMIGDPLDAGVITPVDVVGVYLLHGAMHSLRKSYHPQTGEGSQSGFDYTHELLIDAMQKMVSDYRKEYGDDEVE